MSKRGDNEGSIFQLDDGRWCAFVSLGYRNGKRWRKKFTAKTRGEVQTKVAETLTTRRQGYNVSTTRLTTEQFLATWLETCAKPTLRPATFQSYEQYLSRYIVPRIGRIELSKLQAQHVRECLNEILTSGGVERKKKGADPNQKPATRPLSPRTVQYARAILRKALSTAVQDGTIPRNVVSLVDGPKMEHREVQPFNPEQARALLKAVKGDRLEALLTVAISLGLRQSEICGLRWNDVDLARGTLSVRFAMQKVNGTCRFVEPKSHKSRRLITLPAVTVSALRQHQSVQAADRALAGEAWEEWNLIFTSIKGTPLDGPNLNKRFQKLAAAADLPKIKFHGLRHTAATLLLAQGVHPRIAMDILGHSQIAVTLNLYSHVIPTMRTAAADQIDQILKLVATTAATEEEKLEIQ